MNALPSRLLALLCAVAAPCCSADIKRGEMYGYLLFDGERVPKEFDDLTPAEREIVQQRVEKLHRAWTKDRDYLAPPDAGALASLDPALILTPPGGMEAGYVPIVTRQQLAGPAARPHDHGKGRP